MNNTDQSKLEKIIDDAFAIGQSHFPDDYQTLKPGMLKKVAHLIEQRCNVARIDELKQFTHSEGSIHLLADKVSYQPANHDPVHSWPIIDGKVIIIPQLYIKDRIKQLTNKKESL